MDITNGRANEMDFDLKLFWQENEQCFGRFSTDKPRVPLFFILEDHFLIHLVSEISTKKYYADPGYALDMHVRANNFLESEIGIRYYPEDKFHYVKGAFEVRMGTKRVIQEGSTPWLESEVEDIEDVKKIIAFAEKWDARSMAIPEQWLSVKEKLRSEKNKQLLFAHMPNGPATVACNILGTTNTCMFIMEEPEVMDDFFAVMAEKYVEFNEVAMQEDLGHVIRESLCINDDNCYLFPPKQYERFCVPFIQKLIDAFAPAKEHLRRQHSDSDMGHLMRFLNELGINEVNFGPELDVKDIRAAMPKAIIHGHTPPFILRNGTSEEIASCVKRTFECVGGDGGLVESLSGVVPESTPMENIRAYMHAVHRLTRYR